MGGGGLGRSAFHSRRSLEEGGHVVCGEYAEDWKRVGEGAGGVNAALPCDGSSPALFSRNFPKFFFPPRGSRSDTKDAALRTAVRGDFAATRLSTLTHYIVVVSSSHRSCEEHRRGKKKMIEPSCPCKTGRDYYGKHGRQRVLSLHDVIS